MKTEKTVDRGSKEKLYVQIYSIFLEKIATGEWPAGSQIPPEDELCRIYDVSKITVREAIQELVREGYFRRVQGKGTFVTIPEKPHGILMRTRLSEDFFREEVVTEKVILKKGLKDIDENTKNIFLVEEQIYYILTRKKAGEKSYIEEFFVPYYIIPRIEAMNLESVSLYDLIEEKGAKKIFRINQEIDLTFVNDETAKILNLSKGKAVLRVRRKLISSDETPIAYSIAFLTDGFLNLQMDFERIK
ncbi:MAG: GntR family transcriptional regulator [Nitrospirae bacterium]|jgi:GntR family transcriptional regulator|nr:GntR family transcriptional regulator [Nitrospirota bacterium]